MGLRGVLVQWRGNLGILRVFASARIPSRFGHQRVGKHQRVGVKMDEQF